LVVLLAFICCWSFCFSTWKRMRSRVRIAAAPSFWPPDASLGMVIDLEPVCEARCA
jgi:hypothetical protein